MAQPTPYDRQFSFQAFQAQEPTTPLPGDEVDGEFNAVKLTIDQTLVNLAKVQRDDGALKNGIVTQDSLSPSLSIGFTFRGVWAEGVNYLQSDGVSIGPIFYRAKVTHFSTAGNSPGIDPTTWETIANITPIGVGVDSVYTAALQDGAVTGPKLGSGSVSSAKIGTAAVTTGKLADGVLSADGTGRGKMADGFVVEDKLAANAVTTGKIADEAITNAKLADMAAATVKGSIAGGTPGDLTIPQVKVLLIGATRSVTSASSAGDRTITAADVGVTVFLGGSTAFTQTIDPVAGFSNGFVCELVVTGTAPVTIDPNASETIDGATTLIVYPGESLRLIFDGSAWRTAGLQPIVKLAVETLSVARGQIDLALPAEFKSFDLRATGLVPVTNTVILYLRASFDGGATFPSSSGNYTWQQTFQVGATITAYHSAGTGTSTGVELTAGTQANTVAAKSLLDMQINRRQNGRYGGVLWRMAYNSINTGGEGGYSASSAADLTHIRLVYSSGNIAAGAEYTLHGRR